MKNFLRHQFAGLDDSEEIAFQSATRLYYNIAQETDKGPTEAELLSCIMKLNEICHKIELFSMNYTAVLCSKYLLSQCSWIETYL